VRSVFAMSKNLKVQEKDKRPSPVSSLQDEIFSCLTSRSVRFDKHKI
jgi:hypothetical protein